MTTFDFLQQHPVILTLVVGLFGLLVGSFLNVVIHRLPVIMERQWRRQCEELAAAETTPSEAFTPETGERYNLVVPRSRCPQCGHAITAVENIPVLSYLWLKGKCSECGTRISARYPLVEAITAGMSAVVALHFGYSFEMLMALVFTWALLALTFIDLDHYLLPDSIVLPLLWLGLLINIPATFAPLQSVVIGAAAGYGVLWLVYHLFRLLTGKEGMGYGDFKLLGALGAWMGWQMLPLIIILSSVVGAVWGLTAIALKRKDRNTAIPFGPYLAAAGWIALLWGDQLTNTYLRFAGL